MPPDANLVFDEIYARCSGRVYQYCYRLCRRNAAEAEDLAQEAFVQAYRCLDQLRGETSVLSWLYTIAFRQHLRRTKRGGEIVPLDEELETTLASPDRITPRLTQMWLDSALERLPDHLRQAVIMVKAEGLTHKEAAEVVGVPLGTMLSRVRDGLIRLRKVLAESPEAPYAASLMPGFVLDRHLRTWAQVSTPPTLRGRVYESLGRPVPTLAPSGQAGSLTTRATGGGATALLSRLLPAAMFPRTPAGVGVATSAGVGTVLLGLYLATHPHISLGPTSPLRATLNAMRGVRTAHAWGTVEAINTDIAGNTEMETGTIEFWFKAPNQLRKTTTFPSGMGSHLDIILKGTGGGAVIRGDRRPSTVLPLDLATARQQFPAFAFFDGTEQLSDVERSPAASTTVLEAELGNEQVQVLNVEHPGAKAASRWSLYVDPVTRLVKRAEYHVDGVGRTSPTVITSIKLDRFEYDGGIPDSVFGIPNRTR